jgi:RimJ/RimL family protein N-acetyltransferase
MSVTVKEVDKFIINEKRYRWLTDPDIDRYIGFSEDPVLGDVQKIDKNVERHFELYKNDEHIGDIRFKYADENDKKLKRAEFYIIVGVRNSGVGSLVFPVLINHVRSIYNQIYCTVHKSNFRSVKLMKKNGFYVDDIIGNELLFRLDLE